MSVQPKIPAKTGPHNAGQMHGGGGSEKFAEPQQVVTPGVSGLDGTHDDIGEKSGFQADTAAYIDKKGTAYGEAAKFNFLPPGMDISHQENCDIRNMPLKKVVEVSYAGDGWEPSPRDLAE